MKSQSLPPSDTSSTNPLLTLPNRGPCIQTHEPRGPLSFTPPQGYTLTQVADRSQVTLPHPPALLAKSIPQSCNLSVGLWFILRGLLLHMPTCSVLPLPWRKRPLWTYISLSLSPLTGWAHSARSEFLPFLPNCCRVGAALHG